MAAPKLRADASPTKRFFIDNLTRDLSLEDAILDLVDNSIDALIRTRRLDVSLKLLDARKPSGQNTLIWLEFSDSEFCIRDHCGGIDLAHAEHNVFRFGQSEGSYAGTLGVYGIGLKRAIFKIGKKIEISSKTLTSGFKVDIDVPAWANTEEWSFPLTSIAPASKASDAGTTIRITQLNDEVKLRLADGTLLKRLALQLSSTYAYFLAHYVAIELNSRKVSPSPMPLAGTSILDPNSKKLQLDGVTVNLVAGLQQRTSDEWVSERAGWYVLCNGRIVVQADKTELTGWGVSGPNFVSKHRGFLGIAFFFSDDPAKLPWNTTKRGLNRDSSAYQNARKEMSALARPVLSFLNNMYGDESEKAVARDLVKDLKPATLSRIVERPNQKFATTVPKTPSYTIVKVQYDAAKADIDRIRRKVGKARMSAGAVGRYALDHYLRTECPE